MKFKDTKLNDKLKKAICEMGYEDLTRIQEETFEPIFRRKDVIAMAKTGSGKTAAYILPLLQNINYTNKSTQVLVVAPTRELVIQIVEQIRKFCKYSQSINCLPIYGGQEIRLQAILLRKGVKIVVGTPGRINDLLDKKVLKLAKLRTIVLDEADEMFSMGFEKEVDEILNSINISSQKLLFSATIADRVYKIASKYLNNPITINCSDDTSILVNEVVQIAIDVKEKMKNECSLRILKKENAKNSMIFCNTKKKTETVYKYLIDNNVKAEMLNSDIRQEEREKILKRLKNGELDTIVVTDVLARGIDVEDLDLVINYDIPFENEYYVHRIGRTARKGKNGVAYTLFTGKQIDRIKEIEKYTNKKFIFENVPSISKDINVDFPISNRGYYIITLNIGKQDGIKNKDIVGAIRATTGMKTEDIGKIEVNDNITKVEIPKNYIGDVVAKFENGIIKGRSVSIIKE